MAVAQLAVFVRSPEAGKAKTRLAGALGPEGAAALYRAFIDDTLRLCERVQASGRVDVALWATSTDDEVTRWADRLGVEPLLQRGEDLGARLLSAFDAGLAHHERVVVIGSDAPTLPAELVANAFESLGAARLTLGPASDGGYYAIGAAGGVRPRFDGVRWSTAHAFEDTVLANAEHSPAVIPPWYDIDEPEDLHVLRAHLALDPAAAPSTARCLANLDVAQR